ncbi:glutaredoxin domain-containing protein [Escherichia coli]
MPSCKSTAEQQGRDFQELQIDGNAAKREEMIKRSGRTTVPRFLLTHSTLAAVISCMHWMHVVDWIPC